MSSSSDTGWVKVANNLGQNPKVLELADEVYLSSLGLLVLILGYCDQNLTDGFITSRAMSRLTHTDTSAEIGALLNAKRHCDEFGIIREIEGGYQVIGYLDWQRSREQVNAKKAQATAAANARWNADRNAVGNAEESREEEKRVEKSREEESRAARATPIPAIPKCFTEKVSFKYEGRPFTSAMALVGDAIEGKTGRIADQKSIALITGALTDGCRGSCSRADAVECAAFAVERIQRASNLKAAARFIRMDREELL